MKNRDKISINDIERVNVNLEIYCWYDKGAIKDYVGVFFPQEAKWQMHIVEPSLEILVREIAHEVIEQRITKPQYNITLTKGSMPRKKEQVQLYTAMPPEATER